MNTISPEKRQLFALHCLVIDKGKEDIVEKKLAYTKSVGLVVTMSGAFNAMALTKASDTYDLAKIEDSIEAIRGIHSCLTVVILGALLLSDELLGRLTAPEQNDQLIDYLALVWGKSPVITCLESLTVHPDLSLYGRTSAPWNAVALLSQKNDANRNLVSLKEEVRAMPSMEKMLDAVVYEFSNPLHWLEGLLK